MDKNEAVRSLYRQRDKMIIWGLTGRTGSGCTTVSHILASESMEKLDLRSYKTCDFKNADERKYSVLYRYMKEGKRWKKFDIIEASSIILSFVVEGTYGKLFAFIDNISKNAEIKEKDQIKKRIVECFIGDEQSKLDIENSIIDGNVSDLIEKCDNIDACMEVEEVRSIVEYFTAYIKEKKELFCRLLRNYTVEKEAESEKQDKKIYDFYTYFMQTIANNLRSSGKVYSDEEIAGKEIIIADRINRIIKAINRYEELSNPNVERVRICIDALRNSAEILYFRDRYRAFYAVAVNTEDVDRRNRLDMNKQEIKSLDQIEYPDDNKIFYHQNIQACLQIADIYIYNPNIYDGKYYLLSEQLMKYLALILQPGLVAPTHIERCMQLAIVPLDF